MDALGCSNQPRRRVVELLQKTLETGLLIALSSLPTPSAAVEPSTDHDVVIVGAGAAGLPARRVSRLDLALPSAVD